MGKSFVKWGLGFLLLVLSGPAVGQTDAEIEVVFWESVECESVRQVELYLEIYPTGAYVVEARACLEGQLGLDRAARILVQQGLRALDYEVGAADGLFGPATRQALRAWQTGKGFAGTGYLTREQAETLMAQGREVVARAQAAAQRAQEEARRQAAVEQEQREAERRRQRAEAERQAQAEREAQARRQAQEADDAAYEKAEQAATVEAYGQYLRAYPQGRHAQEARTRAKAVRLGALKDLRALCEENKAKRDPKVYSGLVPHYKVGVTKRYERLYKHVHAEANQLREAWNDCYRRIFEPVLEEEGACGYWYHTSHGQLKKRHGRNWRVKAGECYDQASRGEHLRCRAMACEAIPTGP